MPVRLGPRCFVTSRGRCSPFCASIRRDLVHHQSRQAHTRQPILGGNARVSSGCCNAPRVRALPPLSATHATLFSYLVMTGEAVAALLLLTGTMTRVGAAVAMFLFLNYMLAKGRMFWSPDSEDAAVFFIGLVVFLGRAGRVWGVDRYLAKRWPKSPLW